MGRRVAGVSADRMKRKLDHETEHFKAIRLKNH